MRFSSGFLVDSWKSSRRYTALLGGIFVYLPIGVPWYFGNLAAYVNSYLHAKVEKGEDPVNLQWVFSAFFIMFTVAVPASGCLVRWVGVRLTLLVALGVHSGAIFSSYFAIRYSEWLLVLVFGAIGGLGAGLAYGPPLQVVVKWMPQHIGLSSGVLLAGFGGGATFYNELITTFVNPDNLQPDVMGDKTRYFSQPDILSRVPGLFLLLGSLTTGLQAVGVLLLRAPRDDEIQSTESQGTQSIEVKRTTTLCDSLPSTPVVLPHTIDTTTTTSKEGQHQHHQHFDHYHQDQEKQQQQQQQHQRHHHHQQQSPINGSASSTHNYYQSLGDDIKHISNAIIPDMTPRQVLTSAHFYILWTALAVNHYGYIIKSNFYKEFGQTEIPNDHFLTLTGTLSTVGVALARLFWGKMADCLGVKTTLVAFMASTTMASAFWYPCVFLGPVVYMVIVVVISFILSGAFVIFPLAALKLFGETHYSTNHGLVLSAQIAMNLISPPVNRALLHIGSWIWLFASITIVNALGTLLSLFLKNDCRRI